MIEYIIFLALLAITTGAIVISIVDLCQKKHIKRAIIILGTILLIIACYIGFVLYIAWVEDQNHIYCQLNTKSLRFP